jgi:flagellar hook-basal body complex protein FliE
MSSDALPAIPPIQLSPPELHPSAELLPVFEGQGVAAGGFGRMVSEGIGEVNRQLLVSQTDLQQLATGNVENLHQIMIRLEESRLSFQLLLQVRNRLLEAYQDIMKMQV